MTAIYPVVIRFVDGREVVFRDTNDLVKEMVRCGDDHRPVWLSWGHGAAEGCWRCLSASVGAFGA